MIIINYYYLKPKAKPFINTPYFSHFSLNIKEISKALPEMLLFLIQCGSSVTYWDFCTKCVPKCILILWWVQYHNQMEFGGLTRYIIINIWGTFHIRDWYLTIIKKMLYKFFFNIKKIILIIIDRKLTNNWNLQCFSYLNIRRDKPKTNSASWADLILLRW